MNLITFDIEEWGLAKIGGYGNETLYVEYNTYLNQILEKLDKTGDKGTFFCTGCMAEYFPHVIKLIKSCGHEIGCHSYRHAWMNKLTEMEAREDMHKAVDLLEQCMGEKVHSYRAPAFSIGRENVWMFDIMAECGLDRDSSIFPGVRDLGGFPDFGMNYPCRIVHNGISFEEYPIPMVSIMGRQIAYSGGGYFRFFPLWYVKHQMKSGEYGMTYFHIGDLVPKKSKTLSKEAYESYFKEKGTFVNRYKRHIKSNLGKTSAMKKLSSLIDSTRFTNIEMASSKIDWINAPIVNL